MSSTPKGTKVEWGKGMIRVEFSPSCPYVAWYQDRIIKDSQQFRSAASSTWQQEGVGGTAHGRQT